MRGTVFAIEEFSVYDGPGIRTSVFLKGCPLRCSWCHNPEGQALQPQIVRSPNGCIGCGSCLRAATVQNEQTVFTEESVRQCPLHLLRTCGEVMESEALCQRLLKNKHILDHSGGGVTFSGGEPLAQSAFLFACLELLQGQLHTAIQTCGYCPADTFQKALSLADCFLFDIKLASEAAHRKYTGVSNKKILKNFSLLAASSVDFIVRIPLIPTVTDTAENIRSIAEILRAHHVCYAELLPYNKMAGSKYAMVQRAYKPQFDESAEVQHRTEIFDAYGIKTKIL